MVLFSLKNVEGVTTFLLCILFDDAVSLSKFCENISEGFKVTERILFPN